MRALRSLAIVTHQFHPLVGGLEQVVRNEARVLAGRGWEVTVLSPRRNQGWKRRERLDGAVITRHLSSRLRGVQSLVETATLLGQLQRLQPHAVHGHGSSWATLSALAHLRRRALPTVLTVHSQSHLPRAGWRGRWQRALMCRAGVITAVAPGVRSRLVELGIPAEMVRLVPNGVDLDRFRPPSSAEKDAARIAMGLPSGGPVVVFCGRLSHEKGVDVLAAAWPAVVERVPRATLLVAGDGPQRHLLEGLVSRGVVLAGMQADVVRALWCSDLLVLPSWREGLPMALIEAQACGLPAIATDTPGSQAVIAHGSNGWWSPVGDAGGLADAIERVLSNPDLLRSVGLQARADALLRWSEARQMDQFEQLLIPGGSSRCA